MNKAKCMVFRQPQRTVSIPELMIDENIIEVVDNFSFLGLNINKNLKWENHIDCISNQISRTIGIMKRIRHVITFDILVMLYNTLILSHINYCILAWGYQSGRTMLLKKKCLRAITGSKLFAHTDPLLKAISILKIEDIFTINQNKLYFKCIKGILPFYFQSLI